MPASKEEWFVAKALMRLGHVFEYQVPVLGGYWVRGGQILDFWIRTTAPRETILEVNGEYWHIGEMGSEEHMKMSSLEKEFGAFANIVVLWGSDLQSESQAYQAVAREIGPA